MPNILELKSGIFPAFKTLRKANGVLRIAFSPCQQCENVNYQQAKGNVMAEIGLFLAIG